MLDEKKTKTAVVVGFLSIFSAYYESRENTHTHTHTALEKLKNEQMKKKKEAAWDVGKVKSG